MSAYRKVKIQELEQGEVYQLRYSKEGKLVLPLSPGAEHLEVTRSLTLTEKAKIRHAYYCLKIAEPEPDAERLELVGHYLSAFDLLCELEEWEEAWEAVTVTLDTPTKQQLHNQLGTWGCYEEQVQLYERLLGKSDPASNVACVANLGNAYFSLGEYRKAIDYYQQSLTIEREIGDRRGEAISLGSLGNAYFALRKYRKAIEFHQQSLTIQREIGDRKHEVASLGNLGNAYNSLGEYQKGIDYYQQGLTISQEISHREWEANALGNLGAAYNSLGKYQKAIDYYQQSLTISRSIENRHGEANSLRNLGNALARLDRKWEASEVYQNARRLFEEMKLEHEVEKCDNKIRALAKMVVVEPIRAPELSRKSVSRGRRGSARWWREICRIVALGWRVVRRWFRRVRG